MIRMAKKLLSIEQRQLQKRMFEAKKRGMVSASLFLEAEMNALTDADCFFFYGNRFYPKGVLSVFFSDEEHAEITVANFSEKCNVYPALFQKALQECRRVGVKKVHTVVDPAYGFLLPETAEMCFSYAWSEYMLCREMSVLAGMQEGLAEGMTLRKEDANEGDGTLHYVLLQQEKEVAECLIYPVKEWNKYYLFGLKTKKEFRRQGMATKLMCEIAREPGLEKDAVMQLQVSSENVAAESLYRKLGFWTEEERQYYKTEEC